jgi:hypothetical protein
MTAAARNLGLGNDPMKMAGALTWLRARGPMLALDLGVNFAAPLVVYTRAAPHWGEVPALLASSVPPLAWSIVGFLRNRRLDAISILAIVGIALSLLAFVGGGSPRLLLLREKMVTLLIGLAFLVSAAIGKPLIWPLAIATMARKSKAEADAFAERRNVAGVRATIMIMTWVWGIGLVADVAVSIVLIFTLSIPAYLIVGPILGYGTMGGLALWTALYRRRRERYGEMMRAKAAGEVV